MVVSHSSDPVWIRTKDLQLRRLLLYPAELRDQLSRVQIYRILLTIETYTFYTFITSGTKTIATLAPALL